MFYGIWVLITLTCNIMLLLREHENCVVTLDSIIFKNTVCKLRGNSSYRCFNLNYSYSWAVTGSAVISARVSDNLQIYS